MRRFALALAVIGILALGATAAQAQPPRPYHGSHYGRHYGHHYAAPRYHGPRVMYPPPVVRHHYYHPGWVVPAPVYPVPYYYPPSSGFYYRGSGISIGIGF